MPIILYFLISLLGASLLFLVQPMAAKVALPILGGAPFVWNSCMVFFQALLLAGYLYAHLLNCTVAVKRQPFIHLPLLALALCAFPLRFTGSSAIDPAVHPMLWLFSMLSLSVGLPFFVLSATSPLSQRWFAACAPTREPYVLYAASNLGSFAGLLAYPVLVEPLLPIPSQTHVLFYGFVLLLALFIAGAWQLRRAPAESALSIARTEAPSDRKTILSWIALAFVPSSLLYGVTTYITTDIASVPLFWVVPLALYLLTFVLIFGRMIPALDTWRTLHRMGAPAMALLALLPLTYATGTLLLHLIIFFATTMMCHSRLAALKPAPQQLTGFFLWVSFGGVLGGIFNSFVAPFLFTTVIEYPLMLVASLLVVGWQVGDARPSRNEFGKIGLCWLIFVAMFWLLGNEGEWLAALTHIGKESRIAALFFSSIALVMMIYFQHKTKPMVQALWLLPMLVLIPPLFNHMVRDEVAFAGRNVFGVSRVLWQVEHHAWVFRHGTTYHGIQSADEALRLKPTSYYAEPLADVYAALPQQLNAAPVGAMGMGIGTVACYGHPHQQYDFFEIDPLVDTIAHDTRYFTYLKDCPPQKSTLLGDGRISLGHMPDKHYGLLIIDTFSSDAIPMHILTREAVAMYATKLKPGGLMAFNISNRYIDLLPVLSAIAHENGMVGASRIHLVSAANSLNASAQWVVLAKDPASLAPLIAKDWQPLPAANRKFLWRDDYSNILRSLRL